MEEGDEANAQELEEISAGSFDAYRQEEQTWEVREESAAPVAVRPSRNPSCVSPTGTFGAGGVAARFEEERDWRSWQPQPSLPGAPDDEQSPSDV